MNSISPATTATRHFPITWRSWIFYFLISLGAALLMVSSQSLWVDEGQTLLYARQSSLSDWMALLLSDRGSQAQMPFGMFAAWLGGRLFGDSEWQLRSLNILWIALAGTAIGRLGQALGLRSLLPLFLVHPFVWYYANEARPYALIICVSAWLATLWGFVHHDRTLSPGRLWAIGALATIGMGSSLLFSFGIVGFAFAFGATMLLRKVDLDRRQAPPVVTTILMMAALMTYYGWTLARGTGGTKIWSVGVSNIAFAVYELLGFGGLGPPRQELRELARTDNLKTLIHEGEYLIGIGILSGAYLALILPLWRSRRDSLTMITVGAVAVSTGALFIASVLVGFPFWGRHLAYLLPLMVLLIARAASQIANGILRKWLMILVFVCLLVSSLCQRFRPLYQKDDYRSASKMAKAAVAQGKTIWWVADAVIARYYGLEVGTNNSGRAIWIYNPSSARDMQDKPAPDLIFVSKPDIHDAANQVRSYIDAHDYRPIGQFTAFRIYARSASRD